MARRIEWRRRAGAACGAALLASSAWGQAAAWPDPPFSTSGDLRIWVVLPNPDPLAMPVVRSAGNPIPKTVQEKTVGDFNPPPPGPTSTGKAPGGFGVLSTGVPQAGAGAQANQPAPPLDPEWLRLRNEMEARFPGLKVALEQVYDTDLADKLDHARPDLLISIPTDRAHFRLASDVFGKQCVTSIWPPDQSPQVEQFDGEIALERRPEICILTTAGHGATARGVAIWFTDRAARPRSTPHMDMSGAPAVAAGALRSALQGEELGADADPEIAGRHKLPTQGPKPYQRTPAIFGSRTLATNVLPNRGTNTTDLHIDIGPVAGNDRFATVMLRAVQSTGTEIGVTHALVVLRRDGAGPWRVLQISPSLLSERQSEGLDLLSRAVKGEEISNPLGTEGTKPLGISEAAPPNGDTRIAPAEMWWDNLGGSSLQVVEWQAQGYATTWLSHLFYVPDNNSRLKTRITARFASDPGWYRWRVWSIGVDGTVVLSPWRTFSIVGS